MSGRSRDKKTQSALLYFHLWLYFAPPIAVRIGMFSTKFAVVCRTACMALPVFLFVIHTFAQTTVEGVVSDPSASPVSNAELDLQREDGQVVQRTSTDANGRFHFAVDAGAYLLTTHAEGFRASNNFFFLRARQPLSLTIELQAN